MRLDSGVISSLVDDMGDAAAILGSSLTELIDKSDEFARQGRMSAALMWDKTVLNGLRASLGRLAADSGELASLGSSSLDAGVAAGILTKLKSRIQSLGNEATSLADEIALDRGAQNKTALVNLHLSAEKVVAELRAALDGLGPAEERHVGSTIRRLNLGQPVAVATEVTDAVQASGLIGESVGSVTTGLAGGVRQEVDDIFSAYFSLDDVADAAPTTGAVTEVVVPPTPWVAEDAETLLTAAAEAKTTTGNVVRVVRRSTEAGRQLRTFEHGGGTGG